MDFFVQRQKDYSGGIGVLVGGNLDYWFEELPLAIRLFGNGYMIPGYDDSMTGFGNLGVSLMVLVVNLYCLPPGCSCVGK